MEAHPAAPCQAEATPPRAEYARRLEERRARQATALGLYHTFARRRNVILGLIVGLTWLAEKEKRVVLASLLVVPAALFVTFVIRRNRAVRAWHRLGRAAAFYEQRLARVDGSWAGTGRAGTRYLADTHPCAPDLDLFGTGSLFELLCTARTRLGEDALADWLCAPAPADEVRRRQAAVAELRSRLDLREEVALLASEVPVDVDFGTLAAWAKAPPALADSRARRVTATLAALLVAGGAGWCVLGTGGVPLLAAALLAAGWALWLRGPVGRVLAPVDARPQGLPALAGLLGRLEREPFTSPLLCRLRATLDAGGVSAARQARRLDRLLSLAPLASLVLPRVPLALVLDSWRRRHGGGLARWLRAVGEFEALASLAAHSYENPDDPFPEIVAEGPCFDAEGLGHPLIPRERCVCNDLRLVGELRVLVVSGSNMSGKSTLLRAAGVNAVLALAGAPVRARRLRLSPLVVGATLRVQDSLQAGRSRFYAEITRVRQLLDLAKGPLPLLFLLDELFQGTNSQDRRLGAEAVVRRLVDSGAAGLVTTHDLALTEIADRLAPRAGNVHFEDRFEGGAMTFDYRMRPGVVRSTNGLALMRAVGIEV